MKINFHFITHLMKTIMVLFISILCSTLLISGQSTRTYATSETHQVIAPCLLCSIQNPSNTIGNNQENYSQLSAPVSLTGGGVSQTLIFPSSVPPAASPDNLYPSFIVLGIGSENNLLSPNLLANIEIQTYNGSTANNDAARADSIAVPLYGKPGRATVIFYPKYEYTFDRVKITLKAGFAGLLQNLQVYYAFHTRTNIAGCGVKPPNPIAYYPFDGNITDVVSGQDAINGNTTIPPYETDATILYSPYNSNFGRPICNQLANIIKNGNFKSLKSKNSFDLPTATLAGWMSTSLGMDQFHIFNSYYCRLGLVSTGSLGKIILEMSTANNKIEFERLEYLRNGRFYHYVVTYDGQNAKLYVNGNLIMTKPLTGELFLYPLEMGNCQQCPSIELDEVLVYNRALSDQEVMTFYSSYIHPEEPASPPSSKNAFSINTPEASNYLQVSPNPGNGTFQLRSSKDISGAAAVISDGNGREVHRQISVEGAIQLPGNIPAGNYYIRIKTKDGETLSGKIILKR